jgi:hypothetical protein
MLPITYSSPKLAHLRFERKARIDILLPSPPTTISTLITYNYPLPSILSQFPINNYSFSPHLVDATECSQLTPIRKRLRNALIRHSRTCSTPSSLAQLCRATLIHYRNSNFVRFRISTIYCFEMRLEMFSSMEPVSFCDGGTENGVC